MCFKDEIKKTIFCFGEPIKIFQNSSSYFAYGLFKQIANNEEDMFFSPSQEKIGQTSSFKFNVWVAVKQKILKIDFIVRNKKNYHILHSKYVPETGCFELLVVEQP